MMLGGDKRVKKWLVVDRPQANSATLLVARGGELAFELNGKSLAVKEPRQCGNYWQEYDFDPRLLCRGENELRISGNGQLWIARDDEYAVGSLSRPKHPNRSARSVDGGKSWSDSALGDEGNIDGEYYVRLWLEHYARRGELQLPVIDTGNLNGAVVAPPIEKLGQIQVSLDFDPCGSNGQCALHIRSGTIFAIDEEHWSAWELLKLNENQAAHTDVLRGRFFQLKIVLTSDDRLSSPQLRGLDIGTTTQTAPGWTTRVSGVWAENRPLIRSSIPFAYEDSNHPDLVRLRRQYDLDNVVKGAASEFEIITRLAAWSSRQWPKLGHLDEAYPPWNALEILKPHGDGTPVGGFCQQFNLVFLQACQSFGIPGRCISIGPGNHTDRIRGGHEVVEVWSNDYRKWIYVDGNAAWYIADEESGEPLSLWELRREQLQALAGTASRALQLMKLAETRYEWKGIDQWPPFIELRLVPRSDFLTNPAPLPLNQGMRGWFWTGYHVSSDEESPARRIYAHHVAKRQNFEWSLNRAELYLEATDTPGEVRVHVDVAMPNFSKLLATIDDRAPNDLGAAFLWKLHAGTNTLDVVPRNKAGRDGIISGIQLQWNAD